MQNTVLSSTSSWLVPNPILPVSSELSRRELLDVSGRALRTLGLLGVLSTLAAESGANAAASSAVTPESQANSDKPVGDAKTKANIVLVHGAFADGSSWSRVIPLLARDGYNVIAVQNPLTSVANDVATTRRVIDALAGPTVVVGHSYGGCVITQAAAGAKNVKALVYVAAMAPDKGETNGAQAAQYPPTLLGKHIVPDAAGFATIDRAFFREIFCADVDETQALVMAATQKPIAGPTFGEPCVAAAWHEIPSYFAISANDHAIAPEQQKAEAARMKSTTITLASSHASLVSHPKEIADLIKKAAQV